MASSLPQIKNVNEKQIKNLNEIIEVEDIFWREGMSRSYPESTRLALRELYTLWHAPNKIAWRCRIKREDVYVMLDINNPYALDSSTEAEEYRINRDRCTEIILALGGDLDADTAQQMQRKRLLEKREVEKEANQHKIAAMREVKAVLDFWASQPRGDMKVDSMVILAAKELHAMAHRASPKSVDGVLESLKAEMPAETPKQDGAKGLIITDFEIVETDDVASA